MDRRHAGTPLKLSKFRYRMSAEDVLHRNADITQIEPDGPVAEEHGQEDSGSTPVPRHPNRPLTRGVSAPQLRHRARTNSGLDDDGFVILTAPENEVEAQKMEQNYMFGFKKWKSHITKRPLQERSEVVQELYKPPSEIKPFSYSTITVSNIIYLLFVGWIMALVYALVGILMFMTIVAWKHGKFCFLLAGYFLWPFGYFVQEQTEYQVKYEDGRDDDSVNSLPHVRDDDDDDDLLIPTTTPTFSSRMHSAIKIKNSAYWRWPATYVWLILGVPFVFLLHIIVCFISWMTIIFLPVAKLNMMAIQKLILMPPEKLKVSRTTAIKPGEQGHEVIMCSYRAANFYSYKYTVDGMSIFFVNMLLFVIIAVVVGFADTNNVVTSGVGKFIMGLLAIIPLAHYIGMAITSISAQSNHIVGAVLNATFGSIVEIILYISSLVKQHKLSDDPENTTCYSEVVKSALTGTLLATMLFIPGICMMVGGLKHKEQRFNSRSLSVSATLLFISVVGVFTPTIFTMTLGGFECSQCFNATNMTDMRCSGCTYVYKWTDNEDFLKNKLRPLVYICIALLFLAYVIGLIFSLKTHTHILQSNSGFPGSQDDLSNEIPEITQTSHKPDVHWGRIKSTIILLIAVVLMSLCAEVVVQNLDPILTDTPFSPVFIGVTVLAVVPDLPEIINGIQFALKNNVNLSLEIGCSVAVQVCLLQIPVLVVADAIMNLHFNLVFNDLHLWSVIISTIILNYIFVDGKSDYFQGCMLCIIYFFLLAMFFFAGDSTKTDCTILHGS